MSKKTEVLEALAEIFAPKKSKSKKAPKFVLVVNDRVLSNRPSSKTELMKAVTAIALKAPTAKIEAYKYVGEMKINLPISGKFFDEEEGVIDGE